MPLAELVSLESLMAAFSNGFNGAMLSSMTKVSWGLIEPWAVSDNAKKIMNACDLCEYPTLGVRVTHST